MLSKEDQQILADWKTTMEQKHKIIKKYLKVEEFKIGHA